MKTIPLVLSVLGVGGLVLLMSGGKAKATAPTPGPVGPVVLEEITIMGDLTKPPVVYRLGDQVRVLTLGRIGEIISFPRAIDPRYPPVEVLIPGFPAQVFAAQDIQHV